MFGCIELLMRMSIPHLLFPALYIHVAKETFERISNLFLEHESIKLWYQIFTDEPLHYLGISHATLWSGRGPVVEIIKHTTKNLAA
jgi:hypothetical protein